MKIVAVAVGSPKNGIGVSKGIGVKKMSSVGTNGVGVGVGVLSLIHI